MSTSYWTRISTLILIIKRAVQSITTTNAIDLPNPPKPWRPHPILYNFFFPSKRLGLHVSPIAACLCLFTSMVSCRLMSNYSLTHSCTHLIPLEPLTPWQRLIASPLLLKINETCLPLIALVCGVGSEVSHVCFFQLDIDSSIRPFVEIIASEIIICHSPSSDN